MSDSQARHEFVVRGTWSPRFDTCWHWISGSVADPYGGYYCRESKFAPVHAVEAPAPTEEAVKEHTACSRCGYTLDLGPPYHKYCSKGAPGPDGKPSHRFERRPGPPPPRQPEEPREGAPRCDPSRRIHTFWDSVVCECGARTVAPPPPPSREPDGERRIGGRTQAQWMRLLDDCIDGSIMSVEGKRALLAAAFTPKETRE